MRDEQRTYGDDNGPEKGVWGLEKGVEGARGEGGSLCVTRTVHQPPYRCYIRQ